jgi:hypothetical protein
VETRRCFSCHGPLEVGRLLDPLVGNSRPSRWAPELRDDPRHGPGEAWVRPVVSYDVAAMRCRDCGRLELYV